MTLDKRLAALGVDLSDLPRKWLTCVSEPYSGEQCYKAHGAAWAWYVGEDQRAVPELEQQETTRDRMVLRQYILHLVDVIDRMETRLVNVTGERDYLVEKLGDAPSDCRACSYYGADGDCHNEQIHCSFDFACVPENWRPTADEP